MLTDEATHLHIERDDYRDAYDHLWHRLGAFRDRLARVLASDDLRDAMVNNPPARAVANQLAKSIQDLATAPKLPSPLELRVKHHTKRADDAKATG